MSKRFDDDVLDAIRKELAIGIVAGSGGHRMIAIWGVVAEKRVFIRSWSHKERSWWRTFLEEPRGTLTVGKRTFPIRAVQTRSERLKDAVDAAYAEKYHTPGSRKYVKDLCGKKSRATTTELVPL